MDYRRLNAQAPVTQYSMLNIQDILSRFKGMNWFTLIDLAAGYWQRKIAEWCRDKTSFRTPQGLFRFICMPFRLTNALAEFMKAMEVAMSGLLGVSTMVYIDNIVVYSRTMTDHRRDVEAVLDRLDRFNLKAKIRKCSFAFQRLPVLGYVITPTRIKTDPKMVEGVLAMPDLKGKKEVRAFMSMINQFRPFIKNLSGIAKSITAADVRDSQMELGATRERHVRAFEEGIDDASGITASELH